MKITLTLSIPESQLTGELYKMKMTREEFKHQIVMQIEEGMDAEDICPGATCKVDVIED